MIILDFTKAFKTTEWSFYKLGLQYFDLGEIFCKMIKLPQTFYSPGRRKWLLLTKSHYVEDVDTISPYVFVVYTDVLSLILRSAIVYGGVKVHNTEMKVSQFVDDTTLFIEED